MKVYWTCPIKNCTHPRETTSHLVPSVPHLHGGTEYQLIPFKKEKKKYDSIRKLKADVWDLFSEWVRRSESINGHCRCVTCGLVIPWKNAQAGHYIHGTLFLIPELVHVQCQHCNGMLHGNLIRYKEYMLNRYGEKLLDKLEFLAKRPHKYTVFELRQFEKIYLDKLKALTDPGLNLNPFGR